MARILLIEPDKILAGNISHYLISAGHDVAAHNDLQRAIETADNNLPDIVILELQLAGRSGIEFLYEFRSYPDWQSRPVIVYTSLKDEDLQDYDRVLQDLNVSGLLYKPQTPLAGLHLAVEAQLAAASR